MATVIDATVGGSSSNSYVTLARGNQLMDDLPHANDWITDLTANKSQLLVHGTALIDRSFNFRGSKTNSTQSLAWPRQASAPGTLNRSEWGWISNEDEYTSDPIPSDIIPNFVEWATVEWAFSLYLDATQEHQAAPGLRRLTTPSFAMEFSDSGKRKIPRSVMQLLMPYGEQRYVSGIRLMRA